MWIHSSWRALIGGFVGAGALIALALSAILTGPVTPLAIGALVTGIILLAIMVFDFPLATVFCAVGLQRRMIGRHQWVGWDRLDRLARGRSSVFVTMWGRRRAGDSTLQVRGGLVAVVGRRRYLLADQTESRAEFERIRALCGVHLPGYELGHLAPSGEPAPTWLYRRRRHRPVAPSDR